MRTTVNAGIGMYDLADFHDLLEGTQVVGDLPIRAFAEEFGDDCAKPASRRVVMHLDMDLGAAFTRRRHEANRAGVIDIGLAD